MPILRDVFQPLDMPKDNNSLLAAFSLSQLLPLLNQSDAFDTAQNVLFGAFKGREISTFIGDLDNYTPTRFPPSLSSFINSHLRPKLAEYLRSHPTEFMGFFSSDETCEQHIEALKTPHHACGAIEIKLLAAMTKTTVHIHTDLTASVEPSTSDDVIHLYQIEGYYQSLIKPEQLNIALRSEPVPVPEASSKKPAFEGDPAAFFRRAAFEKLLYGTLRDVPDQLTTLSVGAPQQSVTFDDALALIAPSKGIQLVPRYEDLDAETALFCTELPKAHLIEKTSLRKQQVRNDAPLASGVSRLPQHTFSTNYFHLLLQASWGGLFNPTDIAYVGQPLAAVTLLLTLGIPAAGSIYAEEYEQALRAAKRLLEENNIKQAAKVLAAEFNRGAFSRTTRSLYLNKEHYAAGHYFSAICAEKQKHISEAYTENALACRDALAAGKRIPVFITKLQKLYLLKHYSDNDMPKGVDRTTELNNTLRELTNNYSQGFTDLYWRVQQRIHTAASAFSTRQILPLEAIQSANYFLEIKSLDMLKHFSNGRGEFLELFGLFFQGLMLGFFHHENPTYLLESMQSKLVTELCDGIRPKTDVVLELATQKFMQCAKRLESFKKDSRRLIASNQALSSGILFLENFMVDFSAQFANRNESSCANYYEIAKTLSISTAEADLKLQETTFAIDALVVLHQDFGLTFESMDAWLDAFAGRELGLLTVAPGKIDTKKLQKDIPTLIKQANRYFIYRLTPDDAESLIELDATIINLTRIAFPAKDSARIKLAYHSQYQPLYDEINQKAGQTLSFAPNLELKTMTSPTTGDTMFHVLVKCQKTTTALSQRIKTATTQFKAQRYHRNHQHETPLMVLRTNDPHQLGNIIATEAFIPISDEFDRIEQCLNRIKTNPAQAEHFLLLEGPSGTGKTEVVKHLLKKWGHPIHDWRPQRVDANAPLTESIKQAFQRVQKTASPHHVHVLFIDDIEQLFDNTEGCTQAEYERRQKERDTFKTEMRNLKGKRVVVIGTTYCPECLPQAFLTQLGTQTISFTLPKAHQRHQLLTYFFRMKQIDPLHIDQLAILCAGYSAPQLRDFAASIEEKTITQEKLITAFNAYARSLNDAFKAEFRCGELTMPSFENETELTGLFAAHSDMEEQLCRLKTETMSDLTTHTLIYGPDGSGKKTAAKVLAQRAGRILISITPNSQELTDENLFTLFNKAKALGRVMIFVDDIDKLSSIASVSIELITSEIERMTKNFITIVGATKDIEKVPSELLDCFHWRIELLSLSHVERNRPVVKSLLSRIQPYRSTVYFDTALKEEMQEGASRLGEAAEGLSLSRVNSALAYLIGDLTRANPGYTGITFIRLQDVRFYLDRIKAMTLKKSPTTITTCTQYIEANVASFFPKTIPLNRCELILQREAPHVDHLDDLPINAHQAYVRVQNQPTNTLYYINRITRECLDLSLKPAECLTFDEYLQPTAKPKDLLSNALKKITAITHHSLIKTTFTIDVLAALHRDFGLEYTSVYAWLNALLAPESTIRTLTSPTTGDTMLHLLTQLTEADDSVVKKVKKAISLLQELRYVRNLRHETAVFVLNQSDPYAFKKIICPSAMIKIGKELEHIDEFIEKARRPGLCKRFLLLEGPPGTGKSETVLHALREQGHIIHEWVGGEENDKWKHAVRTRIREFFEKALKEAENDPHYLHILFMDEIDSVSPKLTGTASIGHYNQKENVDELNMQYDKLRSKQNIVLMGTSNFPDQVASALLSRAVRLLFVLPDTLGREKLLQHFFAHKRISHEHIQRIAELTSGWSPRALLNIATAIKDEITVVDEVILEAAFLESSRVFESDFKRDFPHAHIHLPAFKHTPCADPLAGMPVVQADMRNKFIQLAAALNHPELYTEIRIHTLLHGPQGGGKTSAVRTFARNANYAFILIEAGIALTEMHRLFDRAKAFKPAIIFIDEIDKIAFDGSPFREYLQEEMDGFMKNSISVIGATNYPERIPSPLLDRFAIEIHVPPFSDEQRGELITSMLNEALKRNPTLQRDDELAAELEWGCPNLSDETRHLSVRAMQSRITLFFGALSARQSVAPGTAICATLAALSKEMSAPTLSGSTTIHGFFPPWTGTPGGGVPGTQPGKGRTPSPIH